MTPCDVDHLYDKKKICPDLTITRKSAIIIIYIRIYLYIHCIKLFQSIDNTINLNFPDIKKITIAELISYITNHQNDLIELRSSKNYLITQILLKLLTIEQIRIQPVTFLLFLN